jgi:long-chain acyl-CoA synthetase
MIIGDNAPPWYYAELAVQANQGLSLGLNPDLSPQEIKVMAGNSEASLAVVEDQEQVDKLLQIKDELPRLKHIIFWKYKGLAHYQEPILTGFREILQCGQKYGQEHPQLFERNVAAGRADQACALVYTQATTGDGPRVTVCTYSTMKEGIDRFLRLNPWTEKDDVLPSLPPVRMDEQWLSIGCHLKSACILNFPESPETQQRDIRETKPSIVYYNARFWENQAAAIQARLQAAKRTPRSFYRLLMPVGFKTVEGRSKKKKPGLLEKINSILAELILFKPLRKSLGLSRTRICYSNGAVLSSQALKFFQALNIPLQDVSREDEVPNSPELFAKTEVGVSE